MYSSEIHFFYKFSETDAKI